MVDALRRTHDVLMPDGVVVDVHPTVEPAAVDVGGETVGHVDTEDAPQRHAAADAAVRAVVDEGLFRVDRIAHFDFHTYGDSIEELRDYIAENWRAARINDVVMQRTRASLLVSAPGVKPRVRERVRLTLLRRLAPS